MEASEKDQLALDGGPGVVRALGDRLVIESLTVADERAARVVRERAEAGHDPVATVIDAVEVGARVLDRAGTEAEADYVRREMERQGAQLGERLTRQLEAGEGQLAERIALSFDGTREGSVQQQIKALLARALEEQRSALTRQFTVDDGANPLSDFKVAIVRALRQTDERHQKEAEESRRQYAGEGRQSREQIAGLRREVGELKERLGADERIAEVEEAGTRKGRSFEERVHSALDAIAEGRGDAARHTGAEASDGGGRKGDTLVELDAASGVASGQIVFEAKDKRLSKQEAWRELNGSLEQRGADFAVLVVAGEERVPSGREPLREYGGNKMIVAVDRDDPAGLALEVAYRLAAARVLMAHDRSLSVDSVGVRHEADAALAALKEAQKIRGALTGAGKSIESARGALDAMVELVRSHLERIDGLVADGGPDQRP
jgi:hypothetical protein